MQAITHIANLSEKEKEVLTLIAHGYSSRTIGRVMSLSHETVNSHRKRILLKTGASNIVLVVVMALQRKLISVDLDGIHDMDSRRSISQPATDPAQSINPAMYMKPD